jgi:hypothetical protein
MTWAERLTIVANSVALVIRVIDGQVAMNLQIYGHSFFLSGMSVCFRISVLRLYCYNGTDVSLKFLFEMFTKFL